MFLVISGTKLCLDPTYHTWLQSASIDGHFDTHKGGGLATFYFWLSLQWPQTCGGQRLGLAGYWRLGMMKIVFCRYQAIHISCPLQTAKILPSGPIYCIETGSRVIFRDWKNVNMATLEPVPASPSPAPASTPHSLQSTHTIASYTHHKHAPTLAAGIMPPQLLFLHTN